MIANLERGDQDAFSTVLAAKIALMFYGNRNFLWLAINVKQTMSCEIAFR